MTYVYSHTRADDGQPFYVGMGKTKNRPWNMSKRSAWHKNIVAKHGVRVEIIVDDVEWEVAQWWEVRWIKTLKEAGYSIVNLTEGGDGTKGVSAYNKKSVVCLETGQFFPSIKSAAENFKLAVVSVSDVCRLKYRSVKGLHFVYSNSLFSKDEREDLIKKIERFTAKRRKKVIKNKNHLSPIDGKDVLGRSNAGSMSNAKKVLSVTDGIEFPSASEAARYYNVSKSSIIELCLGKNNRKTSGGVVFKYIDGGA